MKRPTWYRRLAPTHPYSHTYAPVARPAFHRCVLTNRATPATRRITGQYTATCRLVPRPLTRMHPLSCMQGCPHPRACTLPMAHPHQVHPPCLGRHKPRAHTNSSSHPAVVRHRVCHSRRVPPCLCPCMGRCIRRMWHHPLPSLRDPCHLHQACMQGCTPCKAWGSRVCRGRCSRQGPHRPQACHLRCQGLHLWEAYHSHCSLRVSGAYDMVGGVTGVALLHGPSVLVCSLTSTT